MAAGPSVRAAPAPTATAPASTRSAARSRPRPNWASTPSQSSLSLPPTGAAREAEVESLLALLEEYLDRETENLVEDGIRLSIIGRRDRLPARLVSEIERSEAATQFGDVLHLRVAIDYSARDAIAQATRALIANPDFTKEDFARALAGDGTAEVDLLIRTSGEQRLSDFLLWEIAYAELYFTERAWPDFSETDLAQAVTTFRARQRNFGGLPARAA